MSQRTELTAGPAANDMDAELTLVACDGTPFCVRASQLERLSDVFRSMQAMPQPERPSASTAHNTVHLLEDATTLRALLDLTATGVNIASRINSLSLSQLSRIMTAADKYDVPAIRPLVQSCMERRIDYLDPWEDPWPLLVFVKWFGFADLEASVRAELLQTRLDAVPTDADLSYLSSADVNDIMLERRQRVDQFCDALRSERWEAPFALYNRGQYGRCPFCAKDFSNNIGVAGYERHIGVCVVKVGMYRVRRACLFRGHGSRRTRGVGSYELSLHWREGISGRTGTPSCSTCSD